VSLTLAQPWWLLLAALAAPLGVVALRSFDAMSRLRAWSAVVARGGLLALLAAMLAGAASVRQTDRLAVIGVVDVSDSVRRFGGDADRNALERIRRWLIETSAERGPDDLLGVVAFDREAMAVLAPRGGFSRDDADAALSIEQTPLDVRMVDGTDIAKGLRLATAMFPPDAARRIVLISDGAQTAGDALAAAREGAGAGEADAGRTIPIDVVPVSYRVERETMVEFVDAPPRASQEAAVAVRVGLRSTGPTSGVLRLFRQGRPIDINGEREGLGRRVAWEGGRTVETIELTLGEDPIHRFTAQFVPDDEASDALLANNRGDAFTVTPGRGSVLLVDGVSGGDPDGAGAILARTLRDSGLEVELVPPGAAPTDLLSMHAHDLIVFQNVPSEQIPRSTQALLRDYVSELGGGFVMIGGPDSFGAGGWNNTPVEDLLPVRLDLPERLIVPSAAIVLVLDSSGSMASNVLGGRRTQQQIANEGAALAIETLDEGDLIGVIKFSGGYDVTVPLQEMGQAPGAADRVRSIAPGGGTNLYPAMREAQRMLRDVDAQVKHVIVLSDGQSQGAPREGVAVAGAMRDEGVSVSTIAVGDAADVDTLQDIAIEGGGTYHRVLDPNALPRVFVKEVRVVRKPEVREGLFEPIVRGAGSPVLAGVGGDWPPLGGLVLTRRREDPSVVLAATAPGGEPLLAHWSVGLGQTLAFTSDAHDWASRWLDWPGYQRLWTQIARTIARPTTTGRYDLGSEIVDGRLRVRLEAFDEDGGPLDLLAINGRLYRPGGGEAESIRLTQTGPGVYEGTAPVEASGSYVVALTPRLGETPLPPVIGGASKAAGEEHRRLGSDVALLRRLAEATGGRVHDLDEPTTTRLFDRADVPPNRAATPLWPTLLIWALMVYLLDVGVRRIAWDRLITRDLAEEIRAYAAGQRAQRARQREATMTALRGAVVRDRSTPSGQETPAPPEARTEGVAPRSAPREGIRAAMRGESGADEGRGSTQGATRAPGGETESGGAAGLLAAKKRARERYSEPEEGSERR